MTTTGRYSTKTDRLTRAIALAADVHTGQTDKGGQPYILHVLHVMHDVAQHGEDAMIVGVLHDAVEDYGGSGLAKLGFLDTIRTGMGDRVADAVFALTHDDPDEPYEDYIERVAGNYLARIVKIADLTHNMDPRRIPAGQIVDRDFRRWDKYRRSLIRLERED